VNGILAYYYRMVTVYICGYFSDFVYTQLNSYLSVNGHVSVLIIQPEIKQQTINA